MPINPRYDSDNVQFEWGGISPYTAENLLGVQQGGRPSKGEIAEALLMGVLRRGPYPTAEVQRLAEELSISEETLNRARRNLEVRSYRVGGIGQNGLWMLALPGYENPSEAPSDTLSPLRGIYFSQLHPYMVASRGCKLRKWHWLD